MTITAFRQENTNITKDAADQALGRAPGSKGKTVHRQAQHRQPWTGQEPAPGWSPGTPTPLYPTMNESNESFLLAHPGLPTRETERSSSHKGKLTPDQCWLSQNIFLSFF